MQNNALNNIIGYIHICQKQHWERSFDIILTALKRSGLFDATETIFCCVVNEHNNIEHSTLFQQDKFQLKYKGDAAQYERPTLLDMQQHALVNNTSSLYWYAHTKGISKFGTPGEQPVLDWIDLLLYWNMEQWRVACQLFRQDFCDVYGCNYQIVPKPHFSGNFWWTTGKHLCSLPNSIDSDYCSPEFWICSNNPRVHNTVHTGTYHYVERFPREKICSQAALSHRLCVTQNKNTLRFFYGHRNRCVDVTEQALRVFFAANTNAASIATHHIFNTLFGDVVPNVEKTLFIAFFDCLIALPERRNHDFLIEIEDKRLRIDVK
jgi:hypothetical protein